jgi:small subunit ribosomal protein S1
VVDVGGGVLVEVPKKHATKSHARLNDIYRIGQAVKAKVLQVDPQTGTIRVSLADVEPDPWATVAFKRGEIVAGKVVNVGSAVFVEVLPGLVGIAPLPLKGRLRRGDKVACQVAAFDREKRKLHLRLRGRLA